MRSCVSRATPYYAHLIKDSGAIAVKRHSSSTATTKTHGRRAAANDDDENNNNDDDNEDDDDKDHDADDANDMPPPSSSVIPASAHGVAPVEALPAVRCRMWRIVTDARRCVAGATACRDALARRHAVT
jgi:hypothetical protein